MKILQRSGKRFKGYTIGLDLHQSFIEVVVFDSRGNEVENKQIGFKKAALEKLLLEWKLHGEVQVAFEACGCFIWVFELSVRVLGRERVHAAHAAKIKMIAQSSEKDDHSDAWWLAYQLYERRLPEAFVAEGELQDLRHAGRELRFTPTGARIWCGACAPALSRWRGPKRLRDRRHRAIQFGGEASERLAYFEAQTRHREGAD